MHMYMYGAYTYKCTPEKGRSTSFLYNIMVAYAGRGSTRLAAAGVGRSCGDGGGCCTAMRGVGVQLGIVYWLLTTAGGSAGPEDHASTHPLALPLAHMCIGNACGGRWTVRLSLAIRHLLALVSPRRTPT